MTIDALYRGLAAPRQVIPVGREDIPDSERPGPALVALARAALAAGPLPAPDPARAVPARDRVPDAPVPAPPAPGAREAFAPGDAAEDAPEALPEV